MTKRFKDFGYGKAVEAKEPLVFKLYDEEFECYPRVQGKVLLDVISDSAAEDSGATARVILGFFSKVMKEESYVRFEALINDKEKIVPIETLSDIIGWLIGEYGDRPNQEPEELIHWALDLWPYVNGKALLHHINILEMDASEMLDILHVFFEEAHTYTSNEHAIRISRTREVMYESLYDMKYPYAYTSQAGGMSTASGFGSPENDSSDLDEDGPVEEIVPFSPKQRKSYIPPTEANPDSPKPFGSILDAP